MKTKRAWFGFSLSLPFLIGFFFFFLGPAIQSVRFSFHNISTSANEGILYDFVGLSHYTRLFGSDTVFRTRLISNFIQLVTLVPMMLIFSLFAAVLVNDKFPGRSFARIVLFLPVITTSGVMLSIEVSDYLMAAAQNTVAESGQVAGAYNSGLFDIRGILLNANFGDNISNYLQRAVDQLYNIVISSGVQITLFLAALQSISPSLYEASDIEGATAWEKFWKITLPMVSPFVFLCLLYSIIDTFTNSTNGVINYITTVAYGAQLNYGFASAMSWIYFAVIAVVLLVAAGVFIGGKRLFKYD